MPNWKKLIVSGSDATLNSLNVTTNVVADEITATTINATTFNSTVVSSSVVFTSGSNIIGDELTDNHQITGSVFITGSFNVEGGVSASTYQGDGSQLTGLVTDVVETATVFESFTNTLSVSVPHNFNTKNVIATVYQGDEQIIPKSITTTTDNVVTITFNVPTTGRVVVAKGGHIVSGSSPIEWTSVSSSILPSDTEVFDLGSSSKRWRDLYLSGSTIDLGGTKISRDSATGDIEFKDGVGNRKSLKVDELTIGSGATAKKLKVNNGKVQFTDSNDNVDGVDYTELSNIPTGIVSGSSQVDYTSIQNKPSIPTNNNELTNGAGYITSYVDTTYTAGTGINLTGSTFSIGQSVGTSDNVTFSNITATLVDAPIKETRAGGSLSFWKGTQAQYDALGSYDSNTIYFTT